jgi:hypothetical protein
MPSASWLLAFCLKVGQVNRVANCFYLCVGQLNLPGFRVSGGPSWITGADQSMRGARLFHCINELSRQTKMLGSKATLPDETVGDDSSPLRYRNG